MSTRIPVCMLNDTRVDRHHGCERVMNAIGALATANGMEVLATSPAHSDWTRNGAFLRALERSRLIIVNGEGTLHHDRSAARKLLEIGRFARVYGKPVALVNAGWEANSPDFLRMLEDFDLLSMRDAASARAVRAGGLSCRVVPDLSLYGPAPAGSQRGSGERLGFTDSVDRFKAVELDACRRRMGGDFVSIVFPAPGPLGHLRFVRQGFGVRDVRTPATLLRISAMRHRLARSSFRETERFLASLAGYRLLVSGRFHVCTLALITGTPFIAVPSNTGKIAALIADAGLQPWRASASLDERGIGEAHAAGWTAQEREAIASHVYAARAGAEKLFRDMRSLA